MFFIFRLDQLLLTFSFMFFSLILLSSSFVAVLQNNNYTKLFTPFFSSSNHQAFAQYAVAPTSTTGPTVIDPALKVQVISPITNKGTTSMAFVGPNDILVLEKSTGKINRIVNGTQLSKPVIDLAVANKIERGLLGIAVAPNVTSDGKKYVFLYYTQAGGTTDGDEFSQKPPAKGNMVYRYEWSNNQLVNPKLLLQLPANPGSTNRPDHNGGKLAIGADGNVYAVIGEVGGHQTKAANLANGSAPDGTGGILRVTQDGQPVPNSPLGKEPPLAYYFAYGIRNSFGIAFDPVSGNLWDTENGPDYGDEINLVNPGFNSGWQLIQGFAKDSRLGHTDPSDLVKLSKASKYSDPEFEWADPVGPTGLVFLNSDKLGTQYKNDLFVGDVNNGNLYHFKLSEDRTKLLSPDGKSIPKKAITSQQLLTYRFGLGFGGITDLKVGPDGFLYVLANNGAIFRIVPSNFAAANPTHYASAILPGLARQQQQSSLYSQPTAGISNSSSLPADIANKVTIVGVKGLKSYSPNPIKIKVGDIVTWINADIISHTVTSGKDYNPLISGKIFNSGGMISNNVYKVKFAVPGTFDYFCLFHPEMKGQIIVSK
ncbi:MAG: PQQ-dependent sugar dehydrogenase [Candidatus Nitrosocosmicus sp.]